MNAQMYVCSQLITMRVGVMLIIVYVYVIVFGLAVLPHPPFLLALFPLWWQCPPSSHGTLLHLRWTFQVHSLVQGGYPSVVIGVDSQVR